MSDCIIGSMDCSFIGKSGKKTFGIDWFYNGSASRAEKGLEISVIAVIDVEAHQGYSLSVQQTPAQLSNAQAQPNAKGQSAQPPTRIAQTAIEQARTRLQQLPERPSAAAMPESVELTRIDHYLEQLKQTVADLPTRVQYLAVDGFYSKKVCRWRARPRSASDWQTPPGCQSPLSLQGGTKASGCQAQI